MRRVGKKFAAAREQVPEKPLTLEEAVPLVQKLKYAKFDETVEISFRLGVDPKHADQMVRGTVVLPHGLGKTKKVLVIAGGDKQKEALEAGADRVGERLPAIVEAFAADEAFRTPLSPANDPDGHDDHVHLEARLRL